MRNGILGGTFNPPHLGHLICAQEAYIRLELDLVTLMPARIPPHKPVQDEPGPELRLELCRLAVQGDPRFTVSNRELARPGPSYTVDTLKELRTSDPENELFLILGADVAAGFSSWRQPERVLELATLAVAKRAGTPKSRVREALRELPGSERTAFFQMPGIEISSTSVRGRVRVGQSIQYLVPDRVAAYIEGQGLYR